MSTDAQLVHYGLVSLADLHGRHHADTWSRDLFVAFNHLPESRLEAAIGENVAAGWMQSYEAEGAPWIWLPHTDALHEPGYVRHKRGASSCPTPPGYLDPRAGGVIQSGVLDEALRSERLGVGSGRGRRAGWRLLPHRLFHDERHLELSPTAQRVHCGLRTMVDLHGAYTADRWTLRWLFRLEAAELEAALDELVALGWVELYAGAQGSALWLPDHDGLYGAAVASKRGRPVYGTPPRPGEESGVNEGHSGVNVDHSGVNARPAAPAPAAVVELPDPFCRAAAPESSRVQSGVKPPAVR
jgi:hypothetical protein